MNSNPHRVFYLFQIKFEQSFGCLNTCTFESPNSLDSEIASQLFDLFKNLCNQSVEIGSEESLEIDEFGSDFLEIHDLNKDNCNKSEESLSQELNS